MAEHHIAHVDGVNTQTRQWAEDLAAVGHHPGIDDDRASLVLDQHHRAGYPLVGITSTEDVQIGGHDAIVSRHLSREKTRATRSDLGTSARIAACVDVGGAAMNGLAFDAGRFARPGSRLLVVREGTFGQRWEVVEADVSEGLDEYGGGKVCVGVVYSWW